MQDLQEVKHTSSAQKNGALKDLKVQELLCHLQCLDLEFFVLGMYKVFLHGGS